MAKSLTCPSWLGRGFLFVILSAGLLGCGSDAPEVHHVSGEVKFNGKPIPAGQIRFVPDSGKGNSGPTGYAQIKDGKFDTMADGGKGHASGPMIVQIDGNDPAETTSPTTDESGAEPDLKVLFPTYQLEAELPKETTTKNFDVPAEAADVKQQPESIGSPRGGP
jgi:hypothetical protein